MTRRVACPKMTIECDIDETMNRGSLERLRIRALFLLVWIAIVTALSVPFVIVWYLVDALF